MINDDQFLVFITFNCVCVFKHWAGVVGSQVLYNMDGPGPF